MSTALDSLDNKLARDINQGFSPSQSPGVDIRHDDSPRICTLCHRPMTGGCVEAPDGQHSAVRSFSPSQSPTPIHIELAARSGVCFTDALEAIVDGHKVRRLAWPEGECVFFQKVLLRETDTVPAEILRIRLADGSEHRWTISRADLEHADDWVVVNE